MTNVRRAARAAATTLLSLRKVNKSFGAVHVLRDVDLDVRPGQVTALVGDNGAGKSTLIKAVAGIHAFDSGDYTFEGTPVTVTDPKQANALGIEVVYQDLALCDNLDVVHNMFLGRELKKRGTLDEAEMEKRAPTTLAGLSVRTAEVGPPERRQPLRWSAPDRRDRARGALELQAGHPRRADRRPRRRADRAGAQAGPPPRRQRPRRHPHLAQHERRVRGRRRHRVPVPRPDGRAGPAPRTSPTARSSS